MHATWLFFYFYNGCSLAAANVDDAARASHPSPSKQEPKRHQTMMQEASTTGVLLVLLVITRCSYVAVATMNYVYYYICNQDVWMLQFILSVTCAQTCHINQLCIPARCSVLSSLCSSDQLCSLTYHCSCQQAGTACQGEC